MTIGYQALYRAYRPKRFQELVGQEHVTTTLRQAVKSGRVAHAYLFAGPRGTGKTSAAKILAKAINCLTPEDGEPCGRCTHCRAIDAGEALDVVELDAASNRGIDEMRSIRDATWLKPAALQTKVYIIDEAHMLTHEAANALLKTLEEPPEHVVFILATTDPDKMPATIRSRAQRFDFRRLAPEALRARVEEIAGREGIALEPEALRLIVEFADGGLRDALALLDQVRSYAGDRIAAADVRNVAGLPEAEEIEAILAALEEGDAAGLHRALEAAYGAGREPERLARSLARALRERFYRRRKEAGGPAKGEAALARRLRALMEVEAALRLSVDPHLRLEAELIGLLAEEGVEKAGERASEALLGRIAELEARLRALEDRMRRSERSAAGADDAKAPPPTSEENRRPTPAAGAAAPGATLFPSAGAPAAAPAGAADRPGSSAAELSAFARENDPARLKALEERWAKVLAAVKGRDIRAEAWLKRGRPAAVRGEVALLVFTVPLHRQMTEQSDNRRHVEAALAEATGGEIRSFRTAMADAWDRARGAAGDPPIVRAAVELVGPERVEVRYGEEDDAEA
ncbi:DNA polymerase III subunit gamma/tau [Hydrogenibacillus schlegelii]|uniref:DNA polymerase III subunit gamma/tau n=1 Tax=Hydrogenibacillus schlegelii TaxID=1484 RepID=UPI0030B82B39